MKMKDFKSSKFDFVKREKYDTLKNKALRWKEKCDDNDIIILKLEEDIEKLKTECEKLKVSVKNISNEKHELVQKHKDYITKVERDIILKDGKIQRLEDDRKDTKERYKELKEDFREQQRWIREHIK